MLLKRTGMSFKNNWIDKDGRVFIYFTVEEIMRRRNISKPTAIKTFDELDIKKGIGLIERVRIVCLSNLENLNAVFINEGMNQSERLEKLNAIAIEQMKILSESESIKKLK